MKSIFALLTIFAGSADNLDKLSSWFGTSWRTLMWRLCKKSRYWPMNYDSRARTEIWNSHNLLTFSMWYKYEQTYVQHILNNKPY